MKAARYEVFITPLAERDLLDIADPIALDSPSSAARLIARIRGAVARLDQLPLRGANAPEGTIESHQVRQLVVGRYRVLYIVGESLVVILGIRHIRRLPLR